ncbi:MAG: hypothetical protein JWM34_1128 [Ilumatobacteraceae bacterium]|nr:hypothetical protein [Ilumatobacteraceae bacterium]
MKELLVLAAVVAGAAFTVAARQTAFGVGASPSSPPAPTAGGTPVLATYGGRTIDLARSWEGATACAVTAAGITCFATAAERDDFLGSVTSVRLFDGPDLTGVSIAFAMRDPWSDMVLDLAAYSFARRTSSYAIGTRDVTFRDAAGNIAPACGAAGSTATSMPPGWGDRIASIAIG